MGQRLVVGILMFGAVVVLCWPSGRPVATQAKRTPIWSNDSLWFWSVPIGVAICFSDLFSGLLIAGAGPVAWWWRGRRQDEEAKRARRNALPETLDLIAIAVGSGATVSAAISLVHTEGPLPVREAFGRVLNRATSGQPLARALPGLSDELGETYHPLVAALVASVRDGAPLGQLLSRLGDHGRLSRRRRAEERARRLPVLMMFPLAACSMPAVLIGTVVPLVIVGFRSTSF